MDETSQIIKVGDWIARVRQPDGEEPHPVILMVHGLSGDENVMWIFASRLPKDALLIAPRGLYPAPMGGYSWYGSSTGEWPNVADFEPAILALFDLLTPQNFPAADLSQLNLMGFSQGAALCYTLALQHPGRVARLAGLAGFVPDGAEELALSRPLAGKHIFVAHGTRDETVPIARARQGVSVLEQAGAEVTFCEDDVEHKLSANCFRGLGKYFSS